MTEINTIIGVGCSHLYGTDHPSTQNGKIPSKDVWIELLGKDLDCKVLNFSMPGAGNETILRRLKVAINYSIKHNLKPLFILQWTNYTRHEFPSNVAFYSSEDWPYVRPLEEVKKSSDSASLKKISEYYYRAHDEFSLLYSTLQVIEQANLLLDSHNFNKINCIGHCWEIPKIESNNFYVIDYNKKNTVTYHKALVEFYKTKGFTENKSLLEKYNVLSYESTGNIYSVMPADMQITFDNVFSYPWWLYDKDEHQPILDLQYNGLKKFAIDNNYPLGETEHPMEEANLEYFLKFKESLSYKQIAIGD